MLDTPLRIFSSARKSKRWKLRVCWRVGEESEEGRKRRVGRRRVRGSGGVRRGRRERRGRRRRWERVVVWKGHKGSLVVGDAGKEGGS
jgi:hypothetical protein